MFKKLACCALVLCSWSAQALDVTFEQNFSGDYFKTISWNDPGTFSATLYGSSGFVFDGVYLDDDLVNAVGFGHGSSWTIEPFTLLGGYHTLRVHGTVPGTVNASLNYVPAVPEPETAAMLLVGLGVLGASQRRRKQLAAA
ncbi:MAG: FxDxF family PEP-CTERM protein [Leptothrix sp. (in: b-proteobacteria)]